MDLRARLFFVGKCHDSMAGTGATCLAAASRIVGSVAHCMLPPGDPETEGANAALGFVRTARRLMEGTAYVPAD